MSLSVIQDNLVKTHLVQQTQSRGEDIGRVQENSLVVREAERLREMDEVVIHTQGTEQNAIDPDQEGEKQEYQGRKREGKRDGGDGEEEESRHETGVYERHQINILA